MPPTHLLIIGETQSGKTYYANKLHQGSQGTVSVFFNTNHVPYVYGARVSSFNELVAALRSGWTKVNFIPYRGMDDPERKRAAAQLREIIGFFDKLWGHTSTRWGRILIDEAQWFEQECQYAMTMFLGKHVQVLAITQYPKMVDTTSRSNIPTWVIFKSGFQMEKFFQGFGKAFPHAKIVAWTSRKYHFASVSPTHGWRFHGPI